MKILVITRSPWNDSSGLGSTLESIFRGMPDNYEFYNVCFRGGKNAMSVPKSRFQISDMDIFKSIIQGGSTGYKIECNKREKLNSDNEIVENKLYSFFIKRNWKIMWFARELLWNSNKWKSKAFEAYIDEVKPDIIFFPVFNFCYPYKVTDYILKRTDAKLIMYHVDDNYSLQQISFSPLYWIYRLGLRKYIRKFCQKSVKNFVISSTQQSEYKEMLGIESEILTKCADFDMKCPVHYQHQRKVIKIVYTGNLHSNRWKTIGLLADAIKEIAPNGEIQLEVYSGTPMTKKMEKTIKRNPYVCYKGTVPHSKIFSVQMTADILLHVEAFDRRNARMIHQSFSTKIVDYIHTGVCVFAIGPADAASIKHLKDNDMAIVAVNKEEIRIKLEQVIQNRAILPVYAKKAWLCGKEYHDINQMQKKLKEIFDKVVSK